MKEITVSTNMHCERCVVKLAKVLDPEPKIHHWKADVTVPDKWLTVHGDLSEQEVIGFVKKAGFDVGSGSTVACGMDETPSTKTKNDFWRDRVVWKRSAFNTLNCLAGCMIGDFAMIIYLQLYYPSTPMWLQMILATIAGLITSIALETTLMRYKEKFQWKAAFRMAVSMSFLSMVAMEIAMNTTDFMITGGKAQLGSIAYWFAFIPAAVAGFLTPLPYNYYQLKKHNHACH